MFRPSKSKCESENFLQCFILFSFSFLFLDLFLLVFRSSSLSLPLSSGVNRPLHLLIFLSVLPITCLHWCIACKCVNRTVDHIYNRKCCKLTEAPTDIPAEAKEVKLSYNEITDIKSGAFAHLTNCTKLVLSNNRLTHLRGDMFRGMQSLRMLRLSHNRIHHIENGSFAELRLVVLTLHINYITKLEQSDVFRTEHLLLLLGYNPLQCDWRMCWIQQGEQDGWISLSKEAYGTPYCANYLDNNISSLCSVTGEASVFNIPEHIEN